MTRVDFDISGSLALLCFCLIYCATAICVQLERLIHAINSRR